MTGIYNVKMRHFPKAYTVYSSYKENYLKSKAYCTPMSVKWLNK